MISLPTVNQDVAKGSSTRSAVSPVSGANSNIATHHEKSKATFAEQEQHIEGASHTLQAHDPSNLPEFASDSVAIQLSTRAFELLKGAGEIHASSGKPESQQPIQEVGTEKNLIAGLSDEQGILTRLAAKKQAPQHTSNNRSDAETTSSNTIVQYTTDTKFFDSSLISEQRNVAAKQSAIDTAAESFTPYALKEQDYSTFAEIGRVADTTQESTGEYWWVSRMRIGLPSLGTIDLNITLRNDAVAISIMSNRESTEHLSIASSELITALTEVGFSNPRLGVYAHD